MKPASPAAKPESLFYGWYVAFAALVLYFLSNGSAVTLPPVYYPVLIKEFHSNEQALPLAGVITLVTAGILSPFGGALIDRYGVKRLMCIGALMLAATLTAYGFAPSVGYIYVMHLGFAISLTCCGLFVSVTLLSNWFSTYRGTVIGLLVTGSSFAGALLPNVISRVISTSGWRWGYWLTAAVVWLLAVPLTLFVIRNRPADMGLFPDGRTPTQSLRNGSTRPQLPGMTLGEAVRTPVFYFLALGSAMIWYAILAMQSFFKLYLERDLKMTNEQAAFLLSLIFFFSVGGKFGFGFLADKKPKRTVMILTTALLAAGSLFLLTFSASGITTASALPQLVSFTVVFGLGFGGTFSMIQLMVQECFGPREIGRILGTVTFIDTLGAAAGIILTGTLRRQTGNYVAAFEIIVALSFLSLVNMYFVRPLPKHAEPSET
ncbi:MAG: MFS transporter [Blastocatellia bacterium]|nr:MFS transporter [Blastocatellia bacterium]